jgi:tRNA(adenine34) deaminase
MKPQESFMQYVLDLAAKAMDLGELPIAAIVVLDGEVLSEASTTEKRENRFLGHAEILALNKADKLDLTYAQRRKAQLYTNLEPCLMCMGATMSFFLGELIYALESPSDGAIELIRSWDKKDDDFPTYQIPKVTGNVLSLESIQLFKDYVTRHEAGPMRDWAETLTRF